MAYPAWVAPQPLNFMDSFAPGFNIGARLGSEQSGREAFGQYADWLTGRGTSAQPAIQQPMGFLGSMGRAAPQPAPPQVSSNGALSGSFDAVQSATDPALQAALNTSTGNSRLNDSQRAFVNKLMPAAIQASQVTGVDPRIIVAQAAQETGWGRSAPGNNYFGIKSHGQGGGQTLNTHEYVNGQRVNVRDSFRTFGSPEDSVMGYAEFITRNPRYTEFRSARGLDAQLDALQASGYATDPNYSQSVGAIARMIGGGDVEIGSPALGAANAMAEGGNPNQPQANASPAMAFAAPGSPSAPAGTLPPSEVMQALFRSPETRQLAISLAQTAQQGLEPPQFTQFQREDGSIWQLNTQTGQMQVLQGGTGPGSSSFSQTPVFLRDPEGNQHIAQISNTGGILVNGEVLPGLPEGWTVTNRPQGMSVQDDGSQQYVFDPNTGEMRPVGVIQGAPSQNMNVNVDPQTGERSMAPAPGSDQALERQAAIDAREAARRNARDYATTVTQDLGIALEALEGLSGISTWDNPIGGVWSSQMSNLPRTSENVIKNFMESALSNVTLDTMNRMRETSAAGATGFGNMSDRQLRVIQGVLGQWSSDLPIEQQRYIMHRLHNFYMDVVLGTPYEREQAVADGRMTPEENAQYDQLYYPITRDLKGQPLPPEDVRLPGGGIPGQQTPPQPQPQPDLVQTEIVPTRFNDNPQRYQGDTPPADWSGDRNLWPYMTPETRALWP